MKSGIYTITNLVDGKIYVGCAINFIKRWVVHKRDLKTKNHKNYYLQHSVDKYGIENFLFEVLVECEEEYLYSEENYWCNMLDSHNKTRGYNIQPTHPYGKPGHSIETREKMRTSMKNRPPMTEGHKANMRKPKNLTDDARKVLRDRIHTRKQTFKPLICLDNKGQIVREFSSVIEAGEILNIKKHMITKVLTGYSRQTHGYKFVEKKKYNPSIDYSFKIGALQEIQKFSMTGELLKEYESLDQAAKENNVQSSSIAVICGHYLNGKYPNSKSLKGFIYKYKNYIKCK